MAEKGPGHGVVVWIVARPQKSRLGQVGEFSCSKRQVLMVWNQVSVRPAAFHVEPGHAVWKRCLFSRNAHSCLEQSFAHAHFRHDHSLASCIGRGGPFASHHAL